MVKYHLFASLELRLEFLGGFQNNNNVIIFITIFERELAMLAAVQVESLEESEAEAEEMRFQKFM